MVVTICKAHLTFRQPKCKVDLTFSNKKTSFTSHLSCSQIAHQATLLNFLSIKLNLLILNLPLKLLILGVWGGYNYKQMKYY